MEPKMRNYRDFKDYHIEKLRNPEEARLYLDIALEDYEEDGDTEAFLLALRDVAEAQGGLTELAEKAALNRPNLYKILSEEGNPRLKTLGAILHELGFRLSVELVKAKD
jgi:probable addiction module antidote protein